MTCISIVDRYAHCTVFLSSLTKGLCCYFEVNGYFQMWWCYDILGDGYGSIPKFLTHCFISFINYNSFLYDLQFFYFGLFMTGSFIAIISVDQFGMILGIRQIWWAWTCTWIVFLDPYQIHLWSLQGFNLCYGWRDCILTCDWLVVWIYL